MEGHWGPADLSLRIGLEQYRETGCPECGSKVGYLLIRTSEAHIQTCGGCGKTITVIYPDPDAPANE